MLSNGRTELCMFKRPWLQRRNCSVLLQRAREAAVGWGKGFHWRWQGRNIRTWWLLEMRESGAVMAPRFLTKAQVKPML